MIGQDQVMLLGRIADQVQFLNIKKLSLTNQISVDRIALIFNYY